MEPIKPREFSRLVKKKELPPTILFRGEEVLLMDKAFQLLKGELLGENWELNWTVLEGKKTDPQELEEALAIVPFASPRRVVVLREALDFWKAWGRSQEERIKTILSRHPRHTILVLQHVGKVEEKGDPRKKRSPEDQLLEALQGPFALVVNFSGSRGDLEKWVKKRLAKEGLPVDQGVVDWLLDVSQGKMALLEGELEKFILWGKKGEDVERSPSLWDVPTMIYRRDPRLMIHLGNLMAERGVSYFYRIVSSSITRLVAARQALEEGATIQEAVSKTSPFPRERKAMAEALGDLSLREAMDLLEMAMETEIALKSGPRPPDKDLERLMIRILGGTRKGRAG